MRNYRQKMFKGVIKYNFAWVLAIALLLFSGIAYRIEAQYLNIATNTAIKLPIALNNLPLEIGNWKGINLEIPETTLAYMKRNFADDYVSRRYIESKTRAWVDVYVVYCATRPGGMLGHQPLVCYPGNGWIHDNTQKTEFITLNGKLIECLIHRFHKPAPDYKQSIVLNFFIINGRLSTKENAFGGFLNVNLIFSVTQLDMQLKFKLVPFRKRRF